MKTVVDMPYAINLDNIGYQAAPGFKYAIVENSGEFISDCILINIHGERCPGLEYPIPINHSNLSELPYLKIRRILYAWKP
jgi:hypothetical protein